MRKHFRGVGDGGQGSGSGRTALVRMRDISGGSVCLHYLQYVISYCKP